jgi:hypothetical protein
MSQRIIITPDENGNNPTVIADLSQNQNQLPVNVSYHESTTIQTHNAVSVAATGASTESSWHDASGYTQLNMTMLCDANVSTYAYVFWSNDGVSQHGLDNIIASGVKLYGSGTISVRARYFKLQVGNNDAASHTMSAWAYLLA